MSELKEFLSKELLGMEGVTEKFWQTKSGGFTSFLFKNKDFAHFHAGSELDLRLTKKVIASEKLIYPKDSIDHLSRAKRSPWIELRFSSKEDVIDICRLVKLALQQI